MQSLWSRAGQAHRCGCRACSTAVNALGKRATAAARRKPTFAEIFTACYSSVFATAALVDAVRKDDRRKELDRQLEEARRELADLQERRPTNGRDVDPKSPDLSIQQMDSLWRSLKAIYNGRPFMKEIDKPATISASDLVESLKREHYGSLGEASLNAVRRMDYERLERAIIAEESDRRTRYRESHSHAHLLNETINTEQLVRKLMHRADFLPENSSPSPSFDEARKMMDEGYPNFTFRSINPSQAQKNTALLNRRLRSLIGSSNLSMKERIGRVCYNLLVSANPPDMHTYNTLIVAFDKSGHHAFADALVYSFFHDRLLQPTPSTFVAILNHYKCTNNHGKFLRALSCIAGLDARTGGKIRRRHVSDLEEWPLVLLWATDTKRRTLTGDWVWEHVPLNQPLIEEILSGLLHFKLFDQAASFFVSCMRSGVGLSMKTIRQLFDECIHALDWRAAARLIRGFTDSPTKWPRTLLSGDTKSNSYIAGRMKVLLDICGLNYPGERLPGMLLIYLDISGPKLLRFLRALDEELSPEQDSLNLEDGASISKSRVLQIESLWKEYVFVRKTTSSIESKLLYPDLSPRFRLSMALYIGGTAIQRSLQLSQEFTELLPANGGSRHKPSTQLLLEQCRSIQRNVHPSSDHESMSDIDGVPPALEPSLDTISEGVELYEEGEEPRAATLAEPILTKPDSLVSPGSGPFTNTDARMEAGSRPKHLLGWPVSERAASSEERQWMAGA